MSTSFAELKRNRNADVEKLQQQLASKDSPKEDPTFWKITLDKNGNGSALFRFLPRPRNEDVPYVSYISHSFQGATGNYYNELSRRTLNDSDPVALYNAALWKTNRESDREKVKRQSQRHNFVANIYIINDPEKPENNGKVFKYRFGKQILGKIEDMMSPLMGKVNVFDMWDGASFLLRAVGEKVGDKIIPKYDRSAFQAKGPMFDSDDDPRYEEIWNKAHPLAPIVAADRFKSFIELHRRLEEVEGQPIVLNGKTASNGQSNSMVQSAAQESVRPSQQPSLQQELDDHIPTFESSAKKSDDEFDSDYFDRLAEGK